jgi:hypothetical protein
VSGRSKAEEVQFYLDRSKEALIVVLRSIIENPRLANQERIDSLRMLAEHHASIADFIVTRIADGEKKGRDLQNMRGQS